MNSVRKQEKKDSKINYKVILSLLLGLIFFSAIIIITMIELGEKAKPVIRTGKGSATSSKQDEDMMKEVKMLYDSESIAVVKAVDTNKQEVTLYDINSFEEYSLPYSGGTDVRDKYNQVISMNQITIGSIVDIGYDSYHNKIAMLKISNQAWEYVGSTNFNIDSDKQTISIANTKYKYTEGLSVVNENEFVSVTDLLAMDELTIRGLDQTIWSIVVTRGHGKVIVVDHKAFVGGNITIGYESMQAVTEQLEVIVREGNFNLTVENGRYSGTTNVTVKRNEESYVSLKELGPGALTWGKVTFDITPFGADLYINKLLKPYGNPMELSYGSHEIEVSLGGYVSYKGKLDVNSPSKHITITLPERSSSQVVDVVETTESNSGSQNPTEAESTPWNLPNANDQERDDDYREDDSTDYEEDYIVDDNHSIYVQNPLGASVYLNGEFLGISPGNVPKIIGSHVLTFIKEGYETKSYTIEIEDDNLDAYLSMPDLISSGVE